MPDENVKTYLDRTWSLFERTGITDPFRIIEYIAALLVEDQLPQYSIDLRPEMLPRRLDRAVDEIRGLLQQAAAAAQGKAALFDRYVIFRLKDRLPGPGGHYPTPRHIVQFMRHLVQIEPEHRLADFACGTGGFLFAREEGESQAKEVMGVDNAPEWTRLARVNLLLHDYAPESIRDGDPFQMSSLWGRFSRETFDRVLMNPPFGAPVDAEPLRYEVGLETTNSETALTALAMRALSEDGRAAILAPIGLLFKQTAGERSVRERLVGRLDEQGNIIGEYDLEAVISLPKDALQPYGSLQTHVLLFHRKTLNQQVGHYNATWFFQTESDGYPSGRRRDLTVSPTTPNDLTFVEQVLLTRGKYTDSDTLFSADGTPLLGVRRITWGDTYQGAVIEAINGAILTNVAYYPKQEAASSFFLVETTDPNNNQQRYYGCFIIDQDVVAEFGDDKNVLLQRFSEKRLPRQNTTEEGISQPERSLPQQRHRRRSKKDTAEESAPQPIPLAQPQEYVQAFAITAEARILGQAVLTRHILDRDYDLQPKEYAKSLEAGRVIEPSAVLLGRVRRSQVTFLEQIDSLLGRVELTPIAGLRLPSPQQEEIRPLTRLSPKQEELWEQICKLSEARRATLNGLFTLEDLQAQVLDTQEAVRLTLDLFERMGAIVPVTIVDPNQREALPTTFYRRVTERDLWKIEQEA